jgi:GDP-mannose pyrophosphatase NudK
MNDIKILNKETLSKKRFELQTIEFEKKTNEGKIELQSREVYHRPNAISVLLIDHAKKCMLLTRQFRMPVYLHNDNNGYLLETCAGVIDEGETPEETAAREVKEETGYEAQNLKQIASTYTSPASIMEYVYLFVGDIDIDNKAAEGGGLKEEGEEIETVIVSFDDAKQMLMNGEIHDIKTLALLSHFFLHN